MVDDLEQVDEQSTENLDIIANIYEDINELVKKGEINITQTVSCVSDSACRASS